jgi:hypothetical protein
MVFRKSQPVETRIECLSSALTSPLKIKDKPFPEQKAHAREIHKKAGSIHFENLRTAIARTGRYEEDSPHKAGVGTNRFSVWR